MAAEQLQQLRDIHLPAEPGWWPPAPGWWLLAALALAAVVWLLFRLLDAERRRRPIRRARRLYADVYRRYQHGELTAREYLNECNALIKRALIHGVREQQARRATGQAWLTLLDHHLGEPAFTAGPGRLLGNARFRARFTAEADAVHPLVERLLARLKPPGARG